MIRLAINGTFFLYGIVMAIVCFFQRKYDKAFAFALFSTMLSMQLMSEYRTIQSGWWVL